MATKMEEFDQKLVNILYSEWDIQDARVVPKTEDVKQQDGAKRMEATYLYADLADSTFLAKNFDPEFAARVIRGYLRIAVDCIRGNGGHIRSFDGDRVMGIFLDGTRRNNAVQAAMNIQWVVDKALNPKIATRLSASKQKWKVTQRCGIDDGEVFVVRGGARNNSDLVSIGRAPNVAAKLSSIRGEQGNTTVTWDVYAALFDNHKTSSEGEAMWDKRKELSVGPYSVSTYSSGWMRKPV